MIAGEPIYVFLYKLGKEQHTLHVSAGGLPISGGEGPTDYSEPYYTDFQYVLNVFHAVVNELHKGRREELHIISVEKRFVYGTHPDGSSA